MRLDATGRLRFLDERVIRELNRMLTSAGVSVMPHVLEIQLGLDYSQGLAIISVMASEGLCKARLLIYHSCDPELVVGSLPLDQGLPELPWRCPECEREVESYDELAFDVEAVILDSIEVF